MALLLMEDESTILLSIKNDRRVKRSMTSNPFVKVGPHPKYDILSVWLNTYRCPVFMGSCIAQ